jgi:hypothetical protein
MQHIYDEVRTPYKYGLVVAPTDNRHKMDCPTVFRHQGHWYMTYVVYDGQSGKDGRGYETWLAQSEDLLHWTVKGRVLSFRDGRWDENQRGGFPALPDMTWGGSYELQSYQNRYWMTYIGGRGRGYETGPLSIGLASTPQADLGQAVEWKADNRPILSSTDADAGWFESLTQYKSTIYWDRSEKLFGQPFVMFYNAGGINPANHIKGERVGIALSKNLKKWTRYAGNPVFAHETAGTITGDAHIQQMGDSLYVMFYFSAFNPTRPYKAYNTFAVSSDLVHWTDWTGDDLITPSKPYDNLFAHKSYLIRHEGVTYHFYCAVNRDDQRGIAVATSRPVGDRRSSIHFPEPEKNGKRSETVLIEPSNKDDYYGYRQLTHGNLHGSALYQKTFLAPPRPGKRYFLRFEGVGTFATVKVNGVDFGRHPVGRTSLTLDVTKALKSDSPNLLEVRADHPEMITTMPWVCGGCSSEWGFSEGSQPLGIFRPVVLEITDEVRIEPFGVHVWNNDRADSVFVETQVKNYSGEPRTIQVVNKLNDADGRQVFRLATDVLLHVGETRTVRVAARIDKPHLWSTDTPYLYSLASMVKQGNVTSDEVSTPCGIRTLSWPVKRHDGDGRFFLNGKPLFIRGICEYEHQFGQSHAFSGEQITARMHEIRSAGFNAFRDAHQPHHLDYTRLCNELGILQWTQFSAHIWYDTPEFRRNFKELLIKWVKERRNDPAVVMWGLQNESVLPTDFAQECSDLIRSLDPTARTMRVITTCNGGTGTDWNVVQNWSGTYGGDPKKYGSELKHPEQLLNGEYGAWRTLGVHDEVTTFHQNSAQWSESRACKLLEMKIRQAWEARDSICGQFLWIWSSHDNPGRRQPDEAYRMIDKVGPFNYKGLFTPWEEPTDAYYLYRANQVSAATDPMVYLVSHTWPHRFEQSGRRRATIEAYSNCDSVLLYNGPQFLGRKRQGGVGTHFTWENRDIRYNTLRAVAYYKGRAVAEDQLLLKGLEAAPSRTDLSTEPEKEILPTTNTYVVNDSSYTYIYRLNCGGDAYTDRFGHRWMADDTLYSHSWAQDFTGLSPYLGSQRTIGDAIGGTREDALFQSFRFGRHRLSFHFPVSDGRYRIELFFTEPWYGIGGGEKTDCEGWRLFDVAVNGTTRLRNLDLWAESGHAGALKKTITADITGGTLTISFPEVKAGQAVISAIAIATSTNSPAFQTFLPPRAPQGDNRRQPEAMWKAFDTDTVAKLPASMLPEDKNTRTATTYTPDEATPDYLEWNNITVGLAQEYAFRFKYMNVSGQAKTVRFQLMTPGGTVLRDVPFTLPATPQKWKLVSTTSGGYINAGHYRVILSGEGVRDVQIESVDVQ